jgi:hypothetical protein
MSKIKASELTVKLISLSHCAAVIHGTLVTKARQSNQCSGAEPVLLSNLRTTGF